MTSALHATADPGTRGLDALLEPSSIAVLGVSGRRPTWGNRAALASANAGVAEVYAVSPSGGPIEGLDGVTVVQGLGEVPGPVDCVLVALGNERTLPALEECARHGVRAAVLVGVGFGELGGHGAVLQARLLEVAGSAGMRLLGPNCIGLFRSSSGLCFTPFVPPSGSVALLTQSGNVSIFLLMLARRYGFGFSTVVGVGNQADVSFPDLLHWLAGDPATTTVAMYIEGLPPGSGRRFAAGLRACAEAGKSLVVLHGGATTLGVATAATHTGSLAGSAELWEIVLADAGAVSVQSVPAMAEAVAAAERIPRFGGPVMLLTDGGGDSVMTVDALARVGVPLARLSVSAQDRLEAVLPQWAPRHAGLNPVTLDTPGGLQDDPMLLVRCAEAVAGDPDVHAIVVVGLFGGYITYRSVELEAAAKLVELRRSGMPVVIASAYDGFDDEVLGTLRQGGVAVYSSSDQAAAALGGRYRPTTSGRVAPSIEPPRPQGRVLPVNEGRTVLVTAGVPCPEMRTVRPRGDIDEALLAIAEPLCVKLDLPGLTHKSDVQGVRLGLDLDGARAAVTDLRSRFPEASLTVMPTFPQGFELLVGITWDDIFGSAVVVGRGGIWAEVERDTTVVVPPATTEELASAVSRLRCAPMISGGRGQPPLDSQALVDLLQSMCGLAARSERLSVDLNPVILYEHGLAVADFAVVELTGAGSFAPGSSGAAPC
jgi:acetyltransferase